MAELIDMVSKIFVQLLFNKRSIIEELNQNKRRMSQEYLFSTSQFETLEKFMFIRRV